ncbi:hypothetical protein MKZ38_002797 [Zalerion maritima]|uniref:K Homology domain-containing protein n=1 Tax=Zalerion maritima TaxID=339359 RepID=A0AAD5RPR5_9PEZI|nr:hypothetical protein MKZ38_002797 [Zalerion maritima]
MADSGPKIEEILKALQGTGVIQSQQPSSTTPSQTGAPAYPPPPAQQQQYSMPPGMPQYPPPQSTPSYPPSAYPGLSYPPPPTYPPAAGEVDLSAIKPVNSGTVSLQAAIERARAIAAESGVASHDRSSHAPYGSDLRSGHNVDPRGGYPRSHSRSPPARRDPYRDNYSAFRDERREATREYGRSTRDRSYSPGPRAHTSGTFSPRGHNGNARERSPLRGVDDNSEVIEIESSLVGLIIGRQGENLRRVESETGCRVQFLTPPGDPTAYRQCKISGPRARRVEARTSIHRIIEDSGMGAIARAGLEKGGDRTESRNSESNSGDPASLRENEDSMQIMVPDRTVGLIIGRGGETIRDLQERSGCHINIVGESKSINGLRPVNLIGPSDSTMKAKNLILEIVDSDTRNANAGREGRSVKQPDNPRDTGHEKINDSIYVPSEAVGMIIGKGGETIREMQNMTGCKINVSQSSGPGEVEREIGLVGNRDAISKAKRAIEDKVDTVMQRMKNGPGGSGGGSGGGGRGGRGHQRHDDYDKSQNNYGRHDRNDNTGSAQQPPAQQAAAPGGADPYAPYGGYQNYLALWYQAIAGAANNPSADGSKPPGP